MEEKPYYVQAIKDAEYQRDQLAQKIAGLQRELREMESAILVFCGCPASIRLAQRRRAARSPIPRNIRP